MIDVERHLTADRINKILNHADVRPWVAPGTAPVDVSAQVANRDNILLVGEHGACMFFALMPGIYEIHTQVLPEGRGRWTVELLRACADWMFTRTDAYECMTRVPVPHAGARSVTKLFGFTHEFTRSGECVFRDEPCDVEIWSLRIQDWIASRWSDHLISPGEKFHSRLHDFADRIGVTDERHVDDPNHNKYVGAAMTMARHGQVRKGVSFYNRWAKVCRHDPITLLSLDPPTIRIDHGLVVSLRLDGDIEVTRPS